MGTNGKSINHRSTHHPRLCNDFPINAGEHLIGNSCDVAAVWQRKRLLAVDWIITPSGSNMSQKSASYRCFFSIEISNAGICHGRHLWTLCWHLDISQHVILIQRYLPYPKNILLPSWQWIIHVIFGWYMVDHSYFKFNFGFMIFMLCIGSKNHHLQLLIGREKVRRIQSCV